VIGVSGHGEDGRSSPVLPSIRVKKQIPAYYRYKGEVPLSVILFITILPLSEDVGTLKKYFLS
jgi:hypothetical protein